jgi:hypothetical protein
MTSTLDPGSESRYSPWPVGVWRVVVDGSEHGIHDDPSGVRITLEVDGLTAEVQVAQVRGSLVVIAAGQVIMDRDTRGFARLRIDPEP